MQSAPNLQRLSLQRLAEGLRVSDDEEDAPLEIKLRPNQVAPHGKHPIEAMRRDDWLIWYIKAGRGWGKTLAGAWWTKQVSERKSRIAIVAPTFEAGRDICVEGESGLKALIPDLRWNRSMGEMTFPSGARGKVYSAEEPDRLRGPNNAYAWCDEFSSWRYQKETWDMLMFTLRKGASQTVITTTPKPSKLAKEIAARPRTVVTRGTTYENIGNLSLAYIDNIVKPYEGTSLGQQELEAKDIEEVKGALWTRALLEATRVTAMPSLDFFKRIVVAVDPAGSAEDDSDETGVVICGLSDDGHGYVLADRSLRATPNLWATTAVNAYHEFKADRLVAETNNGGDMVLSTIATAAKQQERPVTPKKITATRGKHTRAEPISALYEQGRVHHVGSFAQLEDQLCTSLLDGKTHDDRLDAMVWALTELMLKPEVGATKVYSNNPFSDEM